MSQTQNIVKKEIESIVENNNLYEFSRDLILNSRKLVYQTANFAMEETYWRIGEKMVDEQGGEAYAKLRKFYLLCVMPAQPSSSAILKKTRLKVLHNLTMLHNKTQK